MCGIAGFNGSDEALLRRMSSLLARRGPDGAGTFTDEIISLAHRRLAVLDLTDHSAQPFSDSEAGLHLVYNGEIYNYLELKRELEAKGCRFRSSGDTEVLLRGYQMWGEEVLPKLNGMFGFAVYDSRRRTLFLARDRFGVKPMHYWQEAGRFAFSSEIKALLAHPGVSRGENPLAVYDYLAFNCYNHSEQTFFKSIKQLLPGRCLTYDLNSRTLQIRRWYQLPPPGSARPLSEEKMAEQFRDLFFDSLRLRMRTDVEIGSCLSGGLDSSSIVTGLITGLKLPAAGFKTFSAVVKYPGLDESQFIQEVKTRTGVENYETFPTSGGLLEDLEALIFAQEEPFGGTSIYAQWEVMKLARGKGLKVLLDGQGGDELLAGYPFFLGYYLMQLLKAGKVAEFFREAASSSRKEGLATPLLLAASPGVKSWLWKQNYGDVLTDAFEKKSLGLSEIPFRLYEAVSLEEALARRVEYSLPQLLREEDRSSMAHSIETRLPFLDYRLAEFLIQMPASMKIRGGKTKFILRKALKNILPSKIAGRRDKLGFATPVHDWLREASVRQRLEKDLRENRDFLDRYVCPRKTDKILNDHFAGRRQMGLMIWKLWNLAVWSRMFQTQPVSLNEQTLLAGKSFL